MLPEVGDAVCDDGAPFIIVDEGVTGNPFDVKEDGRAETKVVDVVKTTDGAVNRKGVGEVSEGGEVFLECHVRLFNCRECTRLVVKLKVGTYKRLSRWAFLFG